MTDVSHSDDELVSSYLDGEATSDEVARVEGDPALLARAEELRAAIELAATPVTIPELDLDRMRAAALAESTTTPVVRDLMAAGASRQQRLQRRNRILSVAAGVLLLALAVPLIRSVSESSDHDDAGTDTSAAGDDSANDDGAGFEALSTADAGDDAGDDASGADGAQAESAPTAGDSDDSAGDDSSDAAMDDIADEDTSAGDDGTDRGTLAPQIASGSEGAFNVLPSKLADVGDVDAVAAAALTQYQGYLSDGEFDFAGGDDLDEVPCLEELESRLLDVGIDAVDYTTVVIGGIDHVAALALTETGVAVLYTAPVDSCGPIDDLIIDTAG